MSNAVCRLCHAAVPVPNGRSDARCPQCGQPVAPPAETHITADAQPEYVPAVPAAPQPREGRYDRWDDFRGNSPVVQQALLDMATRVLPDLRDMPRERLPVNLPSAADDLGVPLMSMTPGELGPSDDPLDLQRRLLRYGAITFAVVVLLAIVERYASIKLAVGVFVLAIVILLVLRSRFLRGRRLHTGRVWLFEHGLLWQQGASIGVCHFDEIESFRANQDDTGAPRYTVVLRPNITLELSLLSSPAIMAVAEYIEIRMASAQLMPTLRRIVAGERVRFGSVVLDRRGFVGPGIAAAWPNIVRVMGDRVTVFVDRRGQAAWHPIRARAVSCPLLMLTIAHILTEEAARLPG